jgi:ubiquinone/menaquinone biosynthesis C-methylase UbiE
MTDKLRAYFEALAERWDGLQPPDRGDRLHHMLAPFEALLGGSRTILEVGTGTGALIPCLQQATPRARLVSIDLAGEMLQRARQRCPDVALIQADAHRLPFSAAAFDTVVCHNAFPHFVDKPGALCSLARMLKPGGHLLIVHDLSRERVNAIHGSGGDAIRNDLLPPGVETRRMLLQAGFPDVYHVEDTDERYRVAGRWAGDHQGGPEHAPAPI